MAIKIFSKKVINSTNDYAKKLLRSSPEILDDGFIVIADQQTNGKGTNGKSWYSQSSGGLYYTIGMIPKTFKFDEIENYHQQISECISNTIIKIAGIKPTIKYPNDIYLGNKKIGGILMESEVMPGDPPELDFLIIGIGLNINQTSFPSELIEKATSIQMETNKSYPKVKFIKPITKQLLQIFENQIKVS